MTKIEFLTELEKQLCGLPSEDIQKSLDFYSEMIDDRIEDGVAEEKAVSQIGDIEEITKQILSDISITKLVKQKIKPKHRMGAGEIILLILGSPVWLSLVLALLAVIFSIYVVLWSVIISLWAVFASIVGCAFGVTMTGAVLAFNGNGFIGVAMIGSGVVCAGLSIFMFYGCKAATMGIVLLTKKIALGIKSCFIKKEEV